jgi:hypothetical protein
MRVLLRNKRTRLFYVGPNLSGLKHEEARDFGDVPRAAKFTLEQKLPDVEIVLRYAVCPGEVPLPVLADWCSGEKGTLRQAA